MHNVKIDIMRRFPELPARRFAYPTQAAFLSQAALLEEEGPPKVPALACFLGFAVVCVAIVVAVLVQIDIVSTSTGRLIPSTPIQELQSFDGGIVQDIHVEEGQVVQVDDLLLTLQDPEAEAQLSRLLARQRALRAQAERVRRLAGMPVRSQSAPPPQAILHATRQMDILPLEEAAIASERALARAEIERRMDSLVKLQAMKRTMRTTLGLTKEELGAQRTLGEKGLSPRSVLLATERDAAEAALDIAEIEGQIAETQGTILEARRRLEDVIASRRQRHGDQLSSLMVDLDELDQQIPALRQRLLRSAVRAPTDGIVQTLVADRIGQVISPSDKLLELLPIDGPLLVEARLPTTEIGHVAKGQTVRIAVDGIEPHRAGYLEGHVEKLSPSTFIDDNGAPYYRALIALTNDELGGVRLVPGMTVQAQIKTGQRTILEYLLKPVYRAWDTAFRER